MENVGSDGISEEEMMNKLLPESKGKTGKELEPYRKKFTYALYVVFRSHEPRDSKLVEINDLWKVDHGYLEGR